MKTRNFVVSLLMILVLVSCKDEKDSKTPVEDKNEIKETFDVSFNLIIPKDDTFQLYYTEDGSLNFGDERSVKSVVKGSGQAQDLLFKLPADVLPTYIRLDFGQNPEQENILINSMTFKYHDKTYNVGYGNGQETLNHFFYYKDGHVKYDEATHTIILLKPKDQPFDPYMWSNQLVLEQMEKLYKK